MRFWMLSVLLIVIPCCQQTSKNGGSKPTTIVVGYETQIGRLDPVLLRSPQDIRLAGLIYEGLVSLDPSGKVVPVLAEEWANENHQTWSFKIRQGVAFHESPMFGRQKTREVTAEDVAYSLQRLCRDDAYNSFFIVDAIRGAKEYREGSVSEVGGIQVAGPYSLTVELNRPEPFFLNRLTSPAICVFPKEAYQDQNREKWGLEFAVGTGAFTMKSRSDSQLVLAPNANHWRGPSVGSAGVIFEFRWIDDHQVRLSELKEGRIHLMAVPPGLFDEVLGVDGTLAAPYQHLKSFQSDSFNVHLLGMNTERVKDPLLRRAMTMATDRTAIVNSILKKQAREIYGPIPLGMQGYDSPLTNPFDQEGAAALLEQANYGDDSIELLVHDQAQSELIGQIFLSQMSQIGINIRLTKVNFDGAIQRIVTGDTDLFSMFFVINYSSPEPYIESLFKSDRIPVPNFWRYQNAKVDMLIDGLFQSGSRENLNQNLADIERSILEDSPAIFLFQQKNLFLMDPKVQNFKTNSHDHWFLEAIRIE